jgi:hypothetical protein
MSLVHEALQKAEREKLRKAGIAPTPPVPAASVVHPGQSSATHAAVPVTTVIPLGRETAPQEPGPATAAPPKSNSYLLPALIGCVAIVAVIATVFLVSSAASVWRQSKPVASTPASASGSAETPAVTTAPAPAAKPAEPVQPQPAVQSPVQPPASVSVPPPATSAADESKYKLSGIMTDPDGKFVAVLNGRVAYEGYYIDGATVKKIERNRVTIDDHGHEAVLRLF